MPGFEEVMHEFGEGTLRSGGKHGKVVTNPKQALAIAYRVSGQNRDDYDPKAGETKDAGPFRLPPSLASLNAGPRARRFDKLERLGVPVPRDTPK